MDSKDISNVVILMEELTGGRVHVDKRVTQYGFSFALLQSSLQLEEKLIDLARGFSEGILGIQNF